MSNFKKFAESAGVDINKFENTVITLKGCQHKKLEKRLEAKGYRLNGANKSPIDKYLCTFSDGTYKYYWKHEHTPRGLKPVNYKDIMGDQITTVDFVKGVFVGLLIGFLFGLFF